MTSKIALVVVLFGCVATAQEPARFKLTGVIAGDDEHTVIRTAAGTKTSGHETISQGAVTVDFKYNFSIAADCTFQDYELKAHVQGKEQSVSARRAIDEIK